MLLLAGRTASTPVATTTAGITKGAERIPRRICEPGKDTRERAHVAGSPIAKVTITDSAACHKENHAILTKKLLVIVSCRTVMSENTARVMTTGATKNTPRNTIGALASPSWLRVTKRDLATCQAMPRGFLQSSLALPTMDLPVAPQTSRRLQEELHLC